MIIFVVEFKLAFHNSRAFIIFLVNIKQSLWMNDILVQSYLSRHKYSHHLLTSRFENRQSKRHISWSASAVLHRGQPLQGINYYSFRFPLILQYHKMMNYCFQTTFYDSLLRKGSMWAVCSRLMLTTRLFHWTSPYALYQQRLTVRIWVYAEKLAYKCIVCTLVW